LGGPDTGGQPALITTVRRTNTPADLDGDGPDGARRRQLAARPVQTNTAGVRQRLQAAFAQGRPDGQAWTARTLAEAAGCGRSSAASFLQAQRTQAQRTAEEGS
jgi:hypothetical protein